MNTAPNRDPPEILLYAIVGGDCAVNNGELAVNSTPVYVMAR